MSKYYLGIDLGTSSVKVHARSDEKIIRAKKTYTENVPSEWEKAIRESLQELFLKIDASEICAVALSSQVGTYVIDEREVISWSDNKAKDELDFIRKSFSKEEFLEEISMVHPDIISYPLPRYLYIKKHYPNAKTVCMPKDLVIKMLTGNLFCDPYSYRGLYSFEKKSISNKILSSLGIDFKIPDVKGVCELAGRVTKQAEEKFGLAEGTPVYLGCNDFFAGLIGMGIYKTGSVFDISGTSEHIGYIADKNINTNMVSGPYFNGYCVYGGTKASGISCDFAINEFSLEGLSLNILDKKNPPIFLPYLSGERAPIFDENARGVFFGIDAKTTKKELAYAVLEGVVFSLYDIFTRLEAKKSDKIICGAGSSRDMLMAEIKGELFGKEIFVCTENDSSAMGAALIAMTAEGGFPSLKEAAESVESKRVYAPTGKYREKLSKRFEIYKSLYSHLKDDFKNFKEI